MQDRALDFELTKYIELETSPLFLNHTIFTKIIIILIIIIIIIIDIHY